MHSKAHFHDQHFGMQWRPVNIAIAMLLTLLFLVLLFLFVTITATPANGQNTVPPTARQAATMPQYAGRLAHVVRPASRYNASRIARPTDPRASWKNPADPRRQNRRGGTLDGDDLYNNGPINGTTDAWTLNSGFVVSDTFTIPSGGDNVTGLTFGAWAFPGDVLQSVEISISSQALGGGTIYSDQLINFTQSACSGNQYGFNVCTESSGNFTGPNLAVGTYWVNLQNAVVNNGDPIYWDENSGPSMASENGVGTIPSEAFTVEGSSSTCQPPCPCFNEFPQNGFQVIHDFGEGEDGNTPQDAFTDKSGNLYGKDFFGGGYLLFRLVHEGADWLFKPLSVLGPWDGDTFGPNGSLYGASLILFGNDGSALNLQPPDSVCFTGCPWNDPWIENSIYNFEGNPDASTPTGVVALDREGNIYGTALFGGGGACHATYPGCGAVYELTPTSTGWTEKVIYGFPANADQANVAPWALLVGVDGNLYGLTGSDGEYGY